MKNYKINIPTENSTYLEKCRNILIEMDYILKENSEDIQVVV